MSRKCLSLSAMAAVLGGPVMADVPSVAVDIAPVHSLVARVMDGVGVPDLIVQPGASPHEYSLRPSEAAAMQQADLVFWIGDDLTPWLSDAIDTLAEGATVTGLLDAEDTMRLAFREGALFEAHSHDEDHDDHAHAEGHEEDKKDDHGHEEHSEDEDHSDHDDHDDEDHAGHDHGDHDPHAWLSPNNARTWLNLIAAKLSAADPENAGTYFANASAAQGEIDALTEEINAILAPVRGGNFVVFHDAYQYFEVDFDVPAAGAISIGDSSDPSPARIAEIQGRINEGAIGCVLAEPQFNPGLVEVVLDGTQAQTGVIDPLGVTIDPGPSLYQQLLRNMAKTLAGCF